jgi:APA family basic amino acid/polyamine antiporter
MNPAAPRPIPMKPAPAPPDERQLGVFDAVNIIVGIVIGASLFKIPWLIFANSVVVETKDGIEVVTGGPYSAMLVWILGGVLAFVGALCYAELATSFPRAGGDYVYLTKAFGPLTGFLFGWAQLTVVFTASIGLMAYVFGDFATSLHKLTDSFQFADLSSEFMYAGLAVIVLTLFNIVGVVLGKLAMNLLTILKMIGLIGLIVAGFGWAHSWPNEWPAAIERQADGGLTYNIAWQSLAIILVLYAYGGWNDAAFVAAEVRDPRRNIPRALLLGVGIIMVLYLLVNTAYIVGLGWENVRRPGRLPEELMSKTPLGEWGGKAMSILVMISALGAANGLIFTGARIYATLGNDHRLFGWLGHWTPGRGAPILALLVQAVITLGMLAAFGTTAGHDFVDQTLSYVNITPQAGWDPDKAFETLVAISAPIFWLFFLMTGFSLFILRGHRSAAERPFSVPLYPLLPIIFCNMCAYMLYQSIIYVKWHALFPIGIVLLGIPLYFASRSLGYRDSSA